MGFKVVPVHGKGALLRYDIVETSKNNKGVYKNIEDAKKHKEFLEKRKKERDYKILKKEESFKREKEAVDSIINDIYSEFGVEIRMLNRPIFVEDARNLYERIKESDIRNTRI